ncbi:DUF3265 domain-containing protein [Vibrio vulnificus]
MTRRSSGIHAAWHFWYAVVFGGESGLRKVVLGGIHPLTQRYTFWRFRGLNGYFRTSRRTISEIRARVL